MIRPSYTSGFATRSESRYPRLWEGCVGSWHPGLGPTGLTLRDWSGYGNHGTLTNMDPASDWVVDDRGYSLDFDNVNDHISGIPSISFGTAGFAITCWAKAITTASYRIMVGKDASGQRDWIFGHSATSSTKWQFLSSADGSTSVTSTSSVTTNWTHVAVSRMGSATTIYVNGKAEATDSTSGTNYTASSNIHIGSRQFSGFEQEWHGQLSDVRIYNRALAPQEIALLARYPGIAYERKTRTPAFIAPAAGGIIPRIMHHRRMQGCS